MNSGDLLRAYRRAQDELARLKAGPDATDAAVDEILDEMDDLWSIMTEAERNLITPSESNPLPAVKPITLGDSHV